MEKILVFIPGYNCENQITRVLDQFDDEVRKYLKDIIFVNNRSTDNTEKKVLEYQKKHKELNLKILRNEENYNLGGSHKVAFNYAIKNKYDYLIVLHGDDQGNIKDILPYLKNKEYQKYDAFLGARFMEESKISGYSKLRIFGIKFLIFYFL